MQLQLPPDFELVKQYIKDNCSGDVSLERVAHEVGFSSFYLSKLFKDYFGVTARDMRLHGK